MELEKNKELSNLASDCQLFQGTCKSLEAQLLELRAMLTKSQQGEYAQSKEIQRLIGEHDARVLELDEMKHAVLPRALDKLVSQSDEAVEQVHELEARYAHFTREMNDKAAQLARENEAKMAQLARENEAKVAELAREKESKAAALDRDKDLFIHKLSKQRDQYKEMASVLRDRRLPAPTSSNILQTIVLSTEPPTPSRLSELDEHEELD